jgi:predicted sulfurtransferase
LRIGQISIKSKNFETFTNEMQKIQEFEEMFYNFALDQKPVSSKLKLKWRANIVACGTMLESMTTEEINKYTAKHLGNLDLNYIISFFFIFILFCLFVLLILFSDAEEWNEGIKKENSVIIDTRNWYEYDIGHFKTENTKAINPVSDTFSDSVPIIKELIYTQQKENPNSNFYFYCTGGIRCHLLVKLFNFFIY